MSGHEWLSTSEKVYHPPPRWRCGKCGAITGDQVFSRPRLGDLVTARGTISYGGSKAGEVYSCEEYAVMSVMTT